MGLLDPKRIEVDLSGSLDVIGHVTVQFAIGPFPVGQMNSRPSV